MNSTRFWCILFTVALFFGGGAGIIFAFKRIHEQEIILTTYRPVQAKIVESKINKHKRRKTMIYNPQIVCQYTVDHEDYTSQAFILFPNEQSKKWANGLIHTYQVGKTSEIYYDPKNPSHYILDQLYRSEPYVNLLISVGCFCVGLLFVIASEDIRKPNYSPASYSSGLFKLKPPMKLSRDMLGFLVPTLLWHFTGAWTYFSYVNLANKANLCFYRPVLLYEGIGGIGVIFCIYYLLRWIHHADALVLVDKSEFYLGDTFSVKSEQQLKTNSFVQQALVSLLCEEKEIVGFGKNRNEVKKTYYEDPVVLMENMELFSGQVIPFEGQFTIPEEGPPSTPLSNSGRLSYSWQIQVITKIEGKPDYKGRFFINVKDPKLYLV